jgi:hypothetical protein
MREDINGLSDTFALPAHVAGHKYTGIPALHADSAIGLLIHALAILHFRLVPNSPNEVPCDTGAVPERAYLSALHDT